MIRLFIDEVVCDALVDTGCTKCIVYAPLCFRWKKGNVGVTTVSGESYKCLGRGKVKIQLLSEASVTVKARVVLCKLLNVSFIMCMNGLETLGDVTVRSSNDVWFGIEDATASAAAVEITD